MSRASFAFVAAVLAATTVSVACGSSAPSAESARSCSKASDCTPSEECRNGACVADAVCPSDIQPTFASIQKNVFAVSCGTDGASCHSAGGSTDSGGLDLADDPYTALLGADGKGEGASNLAGSVRKLIRVVPGDPEHSFLVIKLGTKTGTDPEYGSGMPFTDPGSVCPATLDAIRAWIQRGAAK